MPILKLSFFLGPKDQKQPWSYNTSAPSMPSASVLGPLRKREYQTRQQQIRQGTPRRIGCQPQLQDVYHVSEQNILTPSSSPDAPSSTKAGIAPGSPAKAQEPALRSTSSSPKLPVVHPLSSLSSSPSPSLSPSLGSHGKSITRMGQVTEFGGGTSSNSVAESSSSASLRSPHLSVVQLGAGSRRMSTPSMSTTSQQMPYHSVRTESAASSSSSPCHSTTVAPRLNSALSAPRTWIASSTELPSLCVADESNGYYNTETCQRAPSALSMTGYSYSNKLDATSDLVSSGIPAIIDERDYCMEGYDKAFAATWFTHEEVLLGTKCNKIIMLNTRTDKRTIIGRLDECLMESTESALAHVRDLAAKEDSFTQMKTPNVRSSFGLQNTYLPRGGLGRMYDSSIASSTNNNDLGLAHTLERGLRFFNPGRRSSTPSLATAASPNSSSPTATNSATSPIATAAASTVVTQAAENAINGANTNITTNSPGDMSPGTLNSIAAASTSTGIRSLSINPSRTLLAIGSGDPFQVTIYAIPEFEPVGMMYGHTDLVFSLTWISDTVLVTGARDGSMRVWTMGSPVLTNLHSVTREVKVHLPVITRAEVRTKVRDLALNKTTGQLMTLTTEGYVKLWDRESYVQLSKLKLIHSTETVCLTANSDANLFAVGSQSHISIIDPRSTSIVHDIDSCDEGWGVRALDFKSHIITTGGGFGRIGYYDVRAQRYLDGFNNGESTKRFQEIGPGWLNRDTAYAMSISGITIRNAVYTLEYDSTGTRLFAAGGPLQLGLCGAYAALWA